jgi:hypothetical protein
MSVCNSNLSHSSAFATQTQESMANSERSQMLQRCNTWKYMHHIIALFVLWKILFTRLSVDVMRDCIKSRSLSIRGHNQCCRKPTKKARPRHLHKYYSSKRRQRCRTGVDVQKAHWKHIIRALRCSCALSTFFHVVSLSRCGYLETSGATCGWPWTSGCAPRPSSTCAPSRWTATWPWRGP